MQGILPFVLILVFVALHVAVFVAVFAYLRHCVAGRAIQLVENGSCR